MESSSQDQSGSFILGNCLSCQGLVRVPAKAPSNSTVRCPHCSESFALVQILDQAVPELEIVNGNGGSVSEFPDVGATSDSSLEIEPLAEREVFVVPPQLSKGAQRSKRRRSSEKERGKTSSNRRNSESNGSSRRSSGSSNRRHSSQSSFGISKRNSTMEVVKVAVGGALAIPIAYLLVLWVFGQDPLSIGPKVSNVAPFLIPSKLRGESNEKSSALPSAVSKPDDQNPDNQNPDNQELDEPDETPDLNLGNVLSPEPNKAN